MHLFPTTQAWVLLLAIIVSLAIASQPIPDDDLEEIEIDVAQLAGMPGVKIIEHTEDAYAAIEAERQAEEQARKQEKSAGKKSGSKARPKKKPSKNVKSKGSKIRVLRLLPSNDHWLTMIARIQRRIGERRCDVLPLRQCHKQLVGNGQPLSNKYEISFPAHSPSS